MKTHSEKAKKVYCLAPWIHAHVNALGERSLCCQSKGIVDARNVSLAKFWNSDEMKAHRLQMLKDSPPSKECLECKNGIPSINQFKTKFDNFLTEEEIIKRTDENGQYEGSPITFDYRINNICQLSCRTCNAESSSKIENAYIEINKKNEEKYSWTPDRDKVGLLKEIIESTKNKHLSQVYWGFGEAFLQNEHWAVVDEARKGNVQHNIKMIYNTNLSYPPEKLKHYISRLKDFKELCFVVSLDGYGDTGKFIRDGLNWDNFCENLNYLSSAKYMVSFHVTLTIPLLLDLSRLITFCQNYNYPVNVIVCHDEGESRLLSPVNLDSISLDWIIANSKKVLHQFQDDIISKKICTILDSMKFIKRVQFEDSEWLDSMNSLVRKTRILDKQLFRTSLISYYEQIPMLRTWIKNLELHNYFREYLFQNQFPTEKNFYWKQCHKSLTETNRKVYFTHFRMNFEELETFLNNSVEVTYKGDFISIITSKPSRLSRWFTKKNNHEKYNCFEYIFNHNNLATTHPSLKVKAVYSLSLPLLVIQKFQLEKLRNLAKWIPKKTNFFPTLQVHIILEKI